MLFPFLFLSFSVENQFNKTNCQVSESVSSDMAEKNFLNDDRKTPSSITSVLDEDDDDVEDDICKMDDDAIDTKESDDYKAKSRSKREQSNKSSSVSSQDSDRKKDKPEVNPQTLPKCNCPELLSIDCKLETKDLWEKFHNLGTEMIITKSGR